MSQRDIAMAEVNDRRGQIDCSALTGMRRLVVAAALLCCAAAGCQSQSGSSTSGSAGPAPGSQAAHTAKPIDVCSMLSPQDISAVLGVTVQGKSTGKDPEMGACAWENPSTQESVSVEISNPGTARNNVLPSAEPGFPDPTTPGPDGMRYMGGGGTVEFAAGDRSNTVQVAVLSLSADQANSAAIDLARKIAPQVPQ
ncbi:hypothetical protein [Mycobacterium sp.]|uniref:hypothetical protein n=1 Tax=Mycobacterium sp. TaxID=1785 RepID=UPI003CC57F80